MTSASKLKLYFFDHTPNIGGGVYIGRPPQYFYWGGPGPSGHKGSTPLRSKLGIFVHVLRLMDRISKNTVSLFSELRMFADVGQFVCRTCVAYTLCVRHYPGS